MGTENLETNFQEKNPREIELTYHLPLGWGLRPTNGHHEEMFILTPTLPQGLLPNILHQ